MKASEGKTGRMFVLRLEDGDVIPDCLEQFARDKGIKCGTVLLNGGIGDGEVVVGPRRSAEMPPEPVLLTIDGAHEVAGVGVFAPDEAGNPVLHIHAALGRGGRTLTGCLRMGVKTWLVGEAVITEILNASAVRAWDESSGFVLLDVREEK
jgi:predicted DNA-binding protein with PD1-like motif